MLNYLARIFLAGGIMETIWLCSYGLSPMRSHSGIFVALMLAAFGLCLASYFGCPIKDNRAALMVLGFALLFRISVIPALPDQSEDVYRYLWDARLASLGIDPYQYPPEAAELAQFRDQQIYPMINSKPYVTAYPPLSQALFRLSYTLFGPSVTAMKAVFSLFEFASLVLAWRLLLRFGAGLQPLFLMAWNPFFIFEFSHSGHSDSSMMFLILLSIYLMHRSRKAWAAVSLAGAFLAKLHPALWLPLLVRRAGWQAAALFCAVAGTGVLLCLSPANWPRYFQSLRLYFRLFEFNAGIHYFLRFIGRIGFGESWDKLTGPYLAAILVSITILIAWRFPVRSALDLLHAGFWIMTADLCLATTVHPWYISWAALAIPFFPYAFMVYWTGACFLSYLAYAYHPVYEPAWVLLVEYLPMYVLMLWEIHRGAPLLGSARKRVTPWLLPRT
jgi:alpha-1,6-mannosyltransferase